MKVWKYSSIAITLAAIPIAYFQFKGSAESESRIIESTQSSEVRISEKIEASNNNLAEKLESMKSSLMSLDNTDFEVPVGLFDSISEEVCDSEVGPNIVKYDRGYTFSETFNNRSESAVFLHNFTVKYINPEHLDSGAQFTWTDTIKENNYEIDSGESINYLYTPSPWRIAGESSTQPWDFAIIKTTAYDTKNNTSESAKLQKTTSCIRYKIAQE